MITSNPLSFRIYLFWWWMITCNPLSFCIYLFDDGWLRPIQLVYFCFFGCILLFSMHIFLLTEHVQTVCARFVGPLIAAIYVPVCAIMRNCDTHFCIRLFWLCSWHKFPHWSAPCCLRFRILCMYFRSQLWCWPFICLCGLIVANNIHHNEGITMVSATQIGQGGDLFISNFSPAFGLV